VIMIDMMRVRMPLVEDNPDDAVFIREMLKQARCMALVFSKLTYLRN